MQILDQNMTVGLQFSSMKSTEIILRNIPHLEIDFDNAEYEAYMYIYT